MSARSQRRRKGGYSARRQATTSSKRRNIVCEFNNGAPAVASNVPGLRDAVIDGETGLLYDYGNIEQLAGKILLLLRDDRLRKQLAAGALSYAQSLTWDKSAEIMLDVIEKVMAQRK